MLIYISNCIFLYQINHLKMKFSSIIYSTALLVLSASVQAKLECSLKQTEMYESALDYSSTLQDMIDEASRSK